MGHRTRRCLFQVLLSILSSYKGTQSSFQVCGDL